MANTICPKSFLDFLNEQSISSFYGVPDSLLKNFCAAVTSSDSQSHLIAANEGSALGLAIGSYFATREISCVYLQNSGLGNIINPLLSLASPQVYSIPVLLLVGWRGEVLPNDKQIKDEPQHKHQGLITPSILDTLGIRYSILSSDISNWQLQVSDLLAHSVKHSEPVAILVRKNTFSDFSLPYSSHSAYPTRESAISSIVNLLPQSFPIFSTTGMASRELYEIRSKSTHSVSDFLCVGGMGHVSSIALGFLRHSSHSRVVCLDGDGSIIMHMGSLFRCAQNDGFIHIMLNNGAHDSVGGQPTDSFDIDFRLLSSALGYKHYFLISSLKQISSIIPSLPSSGSIFIEIRVAMGSRPDLGRPKDSPLANKLSFMDSWGKSVA